MKGGRIVAIVWLVGVISIFFGPTILHAVNPIPVPNGGNFWPNLGQKSLINGQPIPASAAPGMTLQIGAGGSPVFTGTSTPLVTATPFAVNGSPVPGTASPGSYLQAGPGGSPTWGPTPSPGPTPDLAPTAIAGLPTCVPGILGRKGQVTDQNCSSLVLLFHANPQSTAGQGCQEPVICAGAPTGTPTPGWVLD